MSFAREADAGKHNTAASSIFWVTVFSTQIVKKLRIEQSSDRIRGRWIMAAFCQVALTHMKEEHIEK